MLKAIPIARALGARVEEIESEDLPFEVARTLSAPFIVAPDYGTRSTTTLLWGNNGTVEFCERRFDSSGQASGESRFKFQAE